MAQGADHIRNYPGFLKPYVLKWKTPINETRKIARDCLYPVIEARIQQERDMIVQGKAAEWARVKPQDSIQWVMDILPIEQRDAEDIMFRMLHITAAAVHTTSFTFSEVLHCMAVTPEYLDELRDEIVTILRQEAGWSKQALTYMKKLDSYITETSRHCVLSSCKLTLLCSVQHRQCEKFYINLARA
jgi:hypothetical protein